MDQLPRTNKQNMTYVPLSTTDPYFVHQARHGMISNDYRSVYFRDTADMRELIRREIEKERIREEIIATELAHKQAIEAALRREILLERELALQRFPPMQQQPSRLSMMMHYGYGECDGRLDDRMPSLALAEAGAFNRQTYQHLPEPKVSEIISPFKQRAEATPVLGVKSQFQQPLQDGMLDKRMPSLVLGEAGAFNRLSYQHLPEPKVSEIISPFQRPAEATLLDVKSQFQQPNAVHEATSIPKATPGKLLVLSKPINPNPSEKKRKAEEATAAGRPSAPIVGKKKKKSQKSQTREWTCKLCQVSTTSEQGLRDHMKGKKHNAKALKPGFKKGKQGK